MAKIGVEVRIDVKKIEKARLYAGQKGTYLTMTTFIDLDEKDQYGNSGFISHKKDQEEQGNTPILGNVKVFWSDNQQQAPQRQPTDYAAQPGGYQGQQSPAPAPVGIDNFDDDIPF